MTADEARARAAHYRALVEQNIGNLTCESLLTLGIAYETYVAAGQGSPRPIHQAGRIGVASLPRCSKAVRIAAASASDTENMLGEHGHAVGGSASTGTCISGARQETASSS